MASDFNKGNMIKEWKQGRVKIRMWDGGYAGKTPAELQKVRNEIDLVCRKCIESAYRESKAV